MTKGVLRLPSASGYLSRVLPEENSLVGWLNGLASQLDVDIRKAVVIKGLLAAQPVPVSLPSLAAKAAGIMTGIECRYVPNGCQARAVLLSSRIDQEFSEQVAISITLESNQYLEVTSGDFQGLYWRYHIAAAVLANDGHVYVLDPVVSNTQPIELATWIKTFKIQKYCYLRIGVADEFQAIPGEKKSVLTVSEEMCYYHALSMSWFDHAFIPPFKINSPVPIVPFYAYAFNAESELRYSFSQPVAAYFESQNIFVDLNLLTCHCEMGSKFFSLFCVYVSDNQTIELESNQVIDYLTMLDGKRFEILNVPCNINRADCLRIIE